MAGKSWVKVMAVMIFASGLVLSCGKPAGRDSEPARAEIQMTEQAQAQTVRAMLPDDIAQARDRWSEKALAWVAVQLAEFPPATVRQPMRKLALTTLDDVLHLIPAPETRPVADFLQRQVELALAGIDGPPPSSGAKIWKLYNDGFVVRTSDHIYGFDINPGVGKAVMTSDQMARLAGKLEVLFISHRHGDHANAEFADLMLEQGKTVVINPDIWPDKSGGKGKLLRIGGDMSDEAAGIMFEVFPGHQSDIPNNVYLVTVDGVKVMHTGDQFSKYDLDGWINEFSDSWRVDVLLPNCWTLEIGRMVESIAPKVVITGHENELGHTVDHRESFSKTYRQNEGLSAPYVVMTWGEMYEWKP